MRKEKKDETSWPFGVEWIRRRQKGVPSLRWSRWHWWTFWWDWIYSSWLKAKTWAQSLADIFTTHLLVFSFSLSPWWAKGASMFRTFNGSSRRWYPRCLCRYDLLCLSSTSTLCTHIHTNISLKITMAKYYLVSRLDAVLSISHRWINAFAVVYGDSYSLRRDR